MKHIVSTLFLLTAVSAWSQPYSPEESLAKIEIEPGFRVELFASEPDVVDPVAMTFDEFGRAFVAEMREMEVLPALEPGTQASIRMLEDSNGDGRVDKSTVYASGLSFPSGLAAHDGGLFALCTPDLLYLKDTDGDGAADERSVVLTGFAQGNAEHRMNNLVWGVDNWIYSANGHGGGQVYDPEAEDGKVVDLNGRDLRFNPRSGEYEAVSRQVSGGFGLTFDDWGRRYVCHNETHVMNVVLPEHYIARNPNLAIGAMGEDISDHGQPDAPVFPISQPQWWRIERTTRRAATMADQFRESQLKVSGYFTAACGVTVYRDDKFPDEYNGSLFVCDAAHNLVHQDILVEKGAAMVASRHQHEDEFLRSADPWFRPVNLHLGPDGALYVLDFYREIIETAASIPEDILAKLDLRAGADKGRVYRITAQDAPPFRPVSLAGKSPEELVAALSDSNGAVRLTAQRLIVDGADPALITPLRSAAAESKTPQGRIHALWTLVALEGLDEPTVLAALDDGHARVREQAVRLAEAFVE